MSTSRIALLVFVLGLAALVAYALLGRQAAPLPDTDAADSTATAVDLNDEEAAAAHILIAYAGSEPPVPGVERTLAEARERAIRIAVTAMDDRASFADLARKYSDDERTRDGGGYLGIYKRGDLPLNVEVPLFDLAVGQINPRVETKRGVHILKRLPVRRAVARHILVAWRGALQAQAAAERSREQARILAGEIHAMCTAEDADFCELAGRFSDDPGSRFQCGLVGVVEPGQLPRAFEEELFRMKIGEISDVVETEFGFHIIQRVE